MKIKEILFATTLFIAISTAAQITKGNWILGGHGSFGNYSTKSIGYEDKGTYLNLNPNIGYFFKDKLVLGANAQLNVQTKFTTGLGIGPYARFYFLGKEKGVNIFSELSYNLYKGAGAGNAKFETLKIKAGTVFFLNSSVGIELVLNYSTEKSNQDYNSTNIYLSAGFQIHLEKN